MKIINRWVSTWRKYPKVLLGYNIVRWEDHEGEHTFPEYQGKLLFNTAKDMAPCHIQRDQPWGFLLEWPLCSHLWYQFRKQDPGIPDSERVLYTRLGIARWDTDGYQFLTFYPPWTKHWD